MSSECDTMPYKQLPAQQGSEESMLDPEAQRLLMLFPLGEHALDVYIEGHYAPGDQWLLKEIVQGLLKGQRWVGHMKPGV